MKFRLLTALAVATLALIVISLSLNLALMAQDAWFGIFSLTFAGSETKAANVLGKWNDSQRKIAVFNLGLDWLTIAAYVATLGGACLLIAKQKSQQLRYAPAGLFAAAGAALAGLCDLVENFALLRMLRGQVHSPWPALAFGGAAVKFGLISLCLLYIFAGRSKIMASRQNE